MSASDATHVGPLEEAFAELGGAYGRRALDLLDELVLGYTTFHRRFDAWDLLDGAGRVAAVICVRKKSGFVTISLPPGPERRGVRAEGPIVMPYQEEVVAHVTADGRPPKGQRKKGSVVLSVGQARELLSRLVAVRSLARAEGAGIAAEVAGREAR